MKYELIISAASPYSSKILALMGYIEVDHRVRIQNGMTRYTVARRLTGQTMVPVLRKGRWAINDSTEIARYLIRDSPKPTLPPGEGTGLAWLLEDFADEWITRWVIHSRWSHREDAREVSELIGRELTGVVPVGSRAVGEQAARFLRGRLKSWGVREENEAALERSGARLLRALEDLLSSGPSYLFGFYPTVTDFAFYGPLIQYRRDPTGRQVLRGYPAVSRYLDRLDAMASRPPAVKIDQHQVRRNLEELQPLLGEALGSYWPVLMENYRALGDPKGVRERSVQCLDGASFVFGSTRYLGRRLSEWLELLDQAYQKGDRLFGEEGIRMERAMVGRIAELCEFEGGRELLRSYPHLGLH